MKIRIKGNSVRLRLTKSEVNALCETGYFEESTQFPNGVFTYALHISNSVEQMAATYLDNKITVLLSNELTSGWATNQQVGFQYNLLLKNGETLSLLVEKDFVCMDESVEDQSDNYPNPKMM